MENTGPVRTIRLEFPADGREKPVRDNLSAVAASTISSGLGPTRARCWIA